LSVCRYYIKDLQFAEDVMLNGSFKVFSNLKNFKATGSFEGWIRKIVVFTALKSNDKRIQKFEPGNLENVPETAFDARAISNLETSELLNILKQLPDGYQTVFNLYAIEGYSHKEIGEMLGISEVTSRTQFSRAKQNLIKLLAKYGIVRK